MFGRWVEPLWKKKFAAPYVHSSDFFPPRRLDETFFAGSSKRT
jgi:hypothetical protein